MKQIDIFVSIREVRFLEAARRIIDGSSNWWSVYCSSRNAVVIKDDLMINPMDMKTETNKGTINLHLDGKMGGGNCIDCISL